MGHIDGTKYFAFTGETFFICATEMTIGMIFISVIINIIHVTKLIEKFEDFIQTSKIYYIFYKTH